MTTTVKEQNNNKPKGETTRIVGTIMGEPSQATSNNGNVLIRFPIIVDPCNGSGPVWWNATVMEPLAAQLGMEFFSKYRYAKFVGLGNANREYKKKDGSKGSSNDILVTAIELQDGTFVKSEKPEAPF